MQQVLKWGVAACYILLANYVAAGWLPFSCLGTVLLSIPASRSFLEFAEVRIKEQHHWLHIHVTHHKECQSALSVSVKSVDSHCSSAGSEESPSAFAVERP